MNCIQIIAPLEEDLREGVSYVPGQHIGHLAKECSAVLAGFMDHGTTDSVYGIDFMFTCLISYCDSNRSTVGYEIDVILQTDNSSLWINGMTRYLMKKGLKPTIII